MYKDLFENATSVRLIYYCKSLTDKEDIGRLKQIFSTLTYVETDKSLKGIMGGLELTIRYKDLSTKKIHFNSQIVACGKEVYKVNRDICQEVRALFE